MKVAASASSGGLGTKTLNWLVQDIGVHNVVAVAATVGLLGREGIIIRRTLVVFLYYAAFAGALGLAIIRYAEDGWMNAGSILLTAMLVGVAVLVRRGRG